MNEELTPEQKAYLDKLVEEQGVEYAQELINRMILYVGTEEDRAKLRTFPPLERKKTN